MQGFFEYLSEEYVAPDDGFFRHTDGLRLSHVDPTGRRIVGRWGYGSPDDGDPLVINATPVGGRNAGVYRGWVTLSRAEWRRITGPRPRGWHSYTVVVGYMPDDETVWWSAVYDDDKLKVCAAEPMDDGRWFRIGPDAAATALLATAEALPTGEDFEMEQTAAFPDLEPDPDAAGGGPRKGTDWDKQQLRVNPYTVLANVREDIINLLKSYDHNHPDRKDGRSNKHLVILGAMLNGAVDLPSEVYYGEVVRAAFSRTKPDVTDKRQKR